MGRPKGSKNKTTIKTKQGLGDIVENITEKTGIKKMVDVFTNGKDCGCDKRKEVLNAIKVQRNVKVNCMNETQYNAYKDFQENRTIDLLTKQGKLENEQINLVTKLYAEITNTPEFKICRNCSPKPIIRMIEVLDQVFNIYKNELND